MQERQVRIPGSGRLLEKRIATYSSILCLENLHGQSEPQRAIVHGVLKRLDTTEATACMHVYKELCFLSSKKN